MSTTSKRSPEDQEAWLRHCDHLESLMQSALSNMAPQLPPRDVQLIQEFIDANEPEVALHWLQSLVVKVGAVVDADADEAIKKATALMRL